MSKRDIWRKANSGSGTGRAPYSVAGRSGDGLALALTGLPVRLDEGSVVSTRLAVLRLAGRRYGLPVGDSIEFLSTRAIVPVPNGPHWIAGIVVRQDVVLPVVDLRRRLGLPRPGPGAPLPVVVADHGEDGVGVIADEVMDVITISTSSIDPPTDVIRKMQASCAMARVGENSIPVLDRGRLRRESNLALSSLSLAGLRAPSRVLVGAGSPSGSA